VVSRDEPRPVVMFTHDGDSEKIRAATLAGVSAYVVDGMSGERIRPIIDAAVARFEQFHALKRELDDVEEKLADRKVIERAKGILMQGRSLSEEDAYRALRKQAMQTNARLVTVARQVVALAAIISS
jgi:two-component system, response regulator / RNA-binding antiterminator